LRGRSTAFVQGQVTRTADYLKNLGVAPCRLFRFPYFSSDLTSRRAVADLGYKMVAANVDTRDWSGRPSGAMASQVLATLKAGDIILFHDAGGNRSQTVQAVRAVLAGMAAKGLRPVTVQTLLASEVPPGQPAAPSGTAP
jgi:peptidoglycan/xylan/chitin deacetylase (PgdA/CDA1 family)